MAYVTLSRQLRFGLHPSVDRVTANGFAAHPPLLGVAPFLTLTVFIRGPIDAATGMLINIKQIDQILRDDAVPVVRNYFYGDEAGGARGLSAARPRGGADLVLQLAEFLKPRFAASQLRALELGLSPYLFLRVDCKEPAVAEISQRFEFSAAHRLHSAVLCEEDNQRVFGKCNNPNGHGHNYELEVTVAGAAGDAGVVIPIAELQHIVHARVVSVFDHKHLNLDCPQFHTVNPTVENIARVIFETLDGAFSPARLKRVRVWETPKTMCEYDGLEIDA